MHLFTGIGDLARNKYSAVVQLEVLLMPSNLSPANSSCCMLGHGRLYRAVNALKNVFIYRD